MAPKENEDTSKNPHSSKDENKKPGVAKAGRPQAVEQSENVKEDQRST